MMWRGFNRSSTAFKLPDWLPREFHMASSWMRKVMRLLAALGVAHGLVTPRIASTAFGTQHVAKRFNPRRAATLEPPKQELPTLPLLRFASPGLADWTSAHLLAAPSQRLLAGVSADRAAADRITVVGGLVNVGLTVAKLAAGVVGHSAALISDAAHSASDLASDVVTFVAMRAARLPADDDHPYGHARFETIGALVVGAMLVAAGAGAADASDCESSTSMTGGDGVAFRWKMAASFALGLAGAGLAGSGAGGAGASCAGSGAAVFAFFLRGWKKACMMRGRCLCVARGAPDAPVEAPCAAARVLDFELWRWTSRS